MAVERFLCDVLILCYHISTQLSIAMFTDRLLELKGNYPLTTSIECRGRDRDALEHLFEIYGCYGQYKCKLMVLTAYFDESGTHEGDHLCVVAGFVGTEDQWKRFIPDWEKSLRPKKHLHMTDLRWNSGKQRIAKLLQRLGPIPDRNNLNRVAGGVWQKDYRELVKGRVQSIFVHPYVCAALLCVNGALECLDSSDRIAFVFEYHERYKPCLDALYEVVFKFDPRISGIAMLRKCESICFEPSDYLAFQIREWMTDKESPKAKLGMSILGSGDVGGDIVKRKQLADLITS
jgi:hypothetical protein